MPTPQLPRDVPIASGLEPVDVHGFPTLGQNANCAIANCFERRLGQGCHLHEPLIRETRLDNRVTTIAVTNRVLMRLDPYQLARLFERPDRPLACLGSVRPEPLPR